MRRFREMKTHEDRMLCESDILAWQYHRPLSEGELEQSYWFRHGMDTVFWFQQVPDDVLQFHLCTAPDHLGVTRRFVTGVEITAELLGAERLIVGIPKGRTELSDYLQRLGWSDTGGLMTRELGGDVWE